MKFYRRDPERARQGMRDLSLELQGLYNAIIDMIYIRERPLPDMTIADRRRLAAECGCSTQRINSLIGKLLESGHVKHVDIDGKRHLADDYSSREIAGYRERKSARTPREVSEKSPRSLGEVPTSRGLLDTKSQENQQYDLLEENKNIEEEDKPPVVPLLAATEVAATGRRSGLPAGYPDDRAVLLGEAMCRTAGVRLDVAAVARRFRAHAEANGWRRVDWAAAWRGWVEVAMGDAPRIVASAPVEIDWRAKVARFASGGFWPGSLGEKPGREGCRAPDEVLREFGFLADVVALDAARRRG